MWNSSRQHRAEGKLGGTLCPSKIIAVFSHDVSTQWLMALFARLKEDSSFVLLFPDGLVPIRSIAPIIPREEGAPPCYLVDAGRLNNEQLSALAQRLYEKWQPELANVEQAIVYMLDGGLPILADNFTAVVGTELRDIAVLL